MFYIYFKLDNKKQLVGLYQERMDSLIGSMESLLNDAGGSRLGREEDIFQFAALYKETALNVLDCAVRLKAYLDKNEENLYGYTIILSAEHDDEDIDIHFHNLSLLVEEENGLWMEADTALRYSSFLEDLDNEDRNILIPVQIKEEKMLFLEDLYRNFLVRTDQIPLVKKDINEWLYRDNEPNGMFVQTQDPEEALILLKEIFEDKENLLEKYLLIEPLQVNYWDVISPLVNCINEDFLDQVERSLPPDSRARWNQDGPFLRKVCQSDWYMLCCDQFYVEFTNAFFLYWQACLRKLDTYPTPPVLILREPESFAEQSLDLIYTLLEGLIQNHPGQKFLLLSKAEAPPEAFQKSPLRSLSIPQAKGEFSVKKVYDSFPENKIAVDEIMKAYSKCHHSLSSLFFHFWNLSENRHGKKSERPERIFLQNQDKVSLEILYICLYSRFFVTKEIVLDFFSSRRIPLPEIEERMKRLETLSFLRFYPGRRGMAGRADVLEFLEKNKNMNWTDLNIDYSRFLEKRIEEGETSSLSGLLFYLHKAGDINLGLSVLNTIINHLLDLREVRLADSLLESALFSRRKLTNAQQVGLYNIRNSGRLRCSLLRGNRRDTEKKINAGFISLIEPQGEYAEEFLLQQAQYHSISGDSSMALTIVKKSLFAFQKNSNHSGETRSNIGLALILLSQRKMQPAMDYFEIAMRIGEQLEDELSRLFSGQFLVLASYLFGNLSMTLRLLEHHIVLVEKERNRDTQIFLLFLKGRVFFELGRYSEAFKVFKQALRLGKAYDLKSQITVVKAWMGRAVCFGHSEKIALEMLDKQPDSLETSYFKAEACFQGGDAGKGAEVLLKGIRKYDRDREYVHELNSWVDGYHLIEGHLSDNNFFEDVLYDQALGFYYFLLGMTGQKKEALEGLKPLCRMDTAYNQQPFGYYFFYYAYALMEGEEDLLKDENPMILLSHSFKLLQTRAGRFDNQQMKHSFFRKNYWNNEIAKKAQELNFI